MEIVWMIIGLVVAAGMFIGAKYRTLVLEVQHLRAQIGATALTQVQPAAHPELSQLDAVALPGAGVALAKPPSDFRLVLSAIKAKSAGRYRITLGWYLAPSGAYLQTAELQGDVNHILITGQSDSGKDNAALGMLLALAHQYSPQRVQFAIIDGKGLDWAGWQHKAHCWHLAKSPEEISVAMDALTRERQRRLGILQAAGVSKWDTYTGDDLPLLVVFVSELLLLQSATSKSDLTNWLEIELTAARAFGIRYILATQTASNFSTQWRSQISLFLAGYQPSASQDAPNIGLSTNEVTGGVPPSKLPAPGSGAAGVFCAVQGAAVVNVRTSYIADNQRDYVLAQLPEKALQTPRPKPAPTAQSTTMFDLLRSGLPLPIADDGVELFVEPPTASYRALESENRTSVELSNARRTLQDSRLLDILLTSYVELPLPDDIVPFAEQRRIIEAAQSVKSKRQLAMKLYNTDGGQKYTWVRSVCDSIGLLQSTGATQ